MKKVTRIAIILLCTLAILIPTGIFAADNTENSKGKPSGSNDTGTTVTYQYMEFGSYPQTEIVAQASDSGVYGKSWAAESDYIIDASLYNTLKNLSEDKWNANGDTTVGGNQYRRIKAGDATCNKSEEANHYNWSSAVTYHYFKYEPIQWRILTQNDSEVFLLSETVLDDQMYNTNITGDLTWETSTIRSWLNGYGSNKNAYGTDYSSNNFIDTAFSPAQQGKIKTVTVENKDNNASGTEGGNDTSDKIFLLSEDEVYGSNVTEYGFASGYNTNDTARQGKSSTYAKAMGAESNDQGNAYWWLRSPGSQPGLFAIVRDSGSVFRGGQHANSKSRGVRPALYLSLSEDNNSSEGDNSSEDKNSSEEIIDQTDVQFQDITANDYFYKAVLWAAKNGITSGVDTTHFAPYANTTRAQMVTFLWRMTGSPEPSATSSKFTDVKASDYYYKAVLWATEKGITAGTSTTTFSPERNVSRCQTVTLLWRYNGKPATSTANPFADVKAGTYYYDAVLWATAQGITKGTGDTAFSPDANCTRGQIVTFLYRSVIN